MASACNLCSDSGFVVFWTSGFRVPSKNRDFRVIANSLSVI